MPILLFLFLQALIFEMPKRTAASVSKTTAGGGGSKPKKTAKAYKFPEHFPSGFIIKDSSKKEWQIQSTIGTGGFGEIYSGCEVGVSSKHNNSFPYAIKVVSCLIISLIDKIN